METKEILMRLLKKCLQKRDKIIVEILKKHNIESERDLINRIIAKKIAFNYLRYGEPILENFNEIMPVEDMLNKTFFEIIHNEMEDIYNEFMRAKQKKNEPKKNITKRKKNNRTIKNSKQEDDVKLLTPEQALFKSLEERYNKFDFQSYRNIVLKYIAKRIANRYNRDQVLDFDVSEEMTRMSDDEMKLLLEEISKSIKEIDDETRNRIVTIIRNGKVNITGNLSHIIIDSKSLPTGKQQDFLNQIRSGSNNMMDKNVPKGEGEGPEFN